MKELDSYIEVKNYRFKETADRFIVCVVNLMDGETLKFHSTSERNAYKMAQKYFYDLNHI